MLLVRIVPVTLAITLAAFAQCTALPEIETLTLQQVRSQIASSRSEFLLYKRLLDLTPLTPKPGILVPQFGKLLDEHRDDARFLYLYGRSLIGFNTAGAITHLRRAAELDPALPWTQTALAGIYASRNFQDETGLLIAIRSFRRLCPANLDGFQYLSHLKDPRETREWTLELRRILENNPSAQDSRYYSLLWDAEFRIAPESQYPALRKRIASDVKRLESGKGPRNREVLSVLLKGYELSDQPEAAAKLEAVLNADFLVTKEYRIWEAKHQLRTRNYIPDSERAAIARDQAAVSAEWVRKWPDSRFAWSLRLSSLPATPGWTKDDMEMIGRRIIELDDRVDHGWSYISEKLRVATVWIRYGIRLYDSLQMAEEALAQIELGPEEPNDLTAGATTVGALAASRYGFDSSHWEAMCAVVDGAIQLKQTAKARPIVLRMQRWLADNVGRSSDPSSGYGSFQSLYFGYEGKLAEADGRKLDAIALYAKAISIGWLGHAPAGEELVNHARELWREQGGSEEGWKLLIRRPLPPAPRPTASTTATPTTAPFAAFESMARPLPPLQLRDTAGKIWTLDNLKGKKTFVNIWATWCLPCRQEFPFVQKLYDLTKSRDGVQVITFNIDDENPGAIAPFLSANTATMPVLVGAYSYVTNFIGWLGIPQNWLVDRHGVLRGKSHGFDETEKDWAARILRELEQLP